MKIFQGLFYVLDKTAKGIPCKVPFKHDLNSPSFYNCTQYGTSKGFWCATTVQSDLTYDDWDWCEGICMKIIMMNIFDL